MPHSNLFKKSVEYCVFVCCCEQQWDLAREKLEEAVKKVEGLRSEDQVRLQEFDVSNRGFRCEGPPFRLQCSS